MPSIFSVAPCATFRADIFDRANFKTPNLILFNLPSACALSAAFRNLLPW
jgi:hypothetical protein